MGIMNEKTALPLKMLEDSKAFCQGCLEDDHVNHVGTFLDESRRVIYCRCEVCIKRFSGVSIAKQTC